MPQIVNFNNRQIIEPGAYSEIKSGIPVPAALGTYGNVMIIDTGSGAGYGFGSGINGEIDNGALSIYTFNTLEDMKRAVRGGKLYDLADYLWIPTNNGNGPNTVYYARAATTVAAKKTLTFTVGSVVIWARSEGIGGNGSVTSGVLTKGYGVRLKAGIANTSALILEFFEGQYRGKNEANVEYDVTEDSVTNFILAQSSEFTNVAELLAWMASDTDFNSYFYLPAGVAVSSATTLVAATELASIGVDILPFSGGTTVYNSTDVDDVLTNIEDLDNSMFLCDDYGPIPSPAWSSPELNNGVNKGAMSSANAKILSYIQNNATYTEKAMYIGGGNDSSKFNVPGGTADGSIQIAKFYDSALCIIVHSGIKMANAGITNGSAFKYLPSLYHAAEVCGRNAGLQPQVPCTYKNLRVSGVSHLLNKSERVLALKSGVLHTRYQSQMGWIINQGINSLQLNSNLVTAAGTSPEIQIMRIIHQLNKELVINAIPRFVGGNLNTSSAEDVKVFVEGYLSDRTATRKDDNLIITFNTVKVVLVQDYWKVSYCFVPNSPINRLFFTGFILDPNISI